MNSDSDPNLK